jgi:hypothetical protein
VRAYRLRHLYEPYQGPFRPVSGWVVRVRAMRRSQESLEATMTEIIEGPITATDRVYAFDEIRQVYPRAPSAVRRARARLTARPHPTGSWCATAECTLVLEDGLIVSAGAIGSSVRDAVDELTTRLRRRFASAPWVRLPLAHLRPADRIRIT